MSNCEGETPRRYLNIEIVVRCTSYLPLDAALLLLSEHLLSLAQLRKGPDRSSRGLLAGWVHELDGFFENEVISSTLQYGYG